MKAVVLTLGLLLSVVGFSQNITVKDNLYYQKENLYTGKYLLYFDNTTTIKKELTIKEGKLNGEVVEYFENGSKKEVGQYEDNLKFGLWFRYNSNGKVVAQASYKNDKKDGQWLVFDDNGNKLFQMEYKNGEKVGTWTQWNENGEVLKTTSYASL